jgi:hypothetical protein
VWQAALERCADQLRAAERAHRARRTVEPEHPVAAPEVTLRVDRVRDSLRLHELARLAGRPLPGGSFVVGEIGGRIVAALPLAGGRPLTDPAASVDHVLPLLELRARQIRRVAIRRGAARRSRLHRA